MSARRIWLPLTALLTLATPVWAADDPPSAELLEFLASWADEEGDFVDPVQFEKVSLPKDKPTPDAKPGEPKAPVGKDGNNGEDRG